LPVGPRVASTSFIVIDDPTASGPFCTRPVRLYPVDEDPLLPPPPHPAARDTRKRIKQAADLFIVVMALIPLRAMF